MAQWPVEPEWIDPSTINNGNQFGPLDGLTYRDLNIIVNDLIYLSGASTVNVFRTLSGESIRTSDNQRLCVQ